MVSQYYQSFNVLTHSFSTKKLHKSEAYFSAVDVGW